MIAFMLYAAGAWVGVNGLLLLALGVVSLWCWLGKPGREKRKAEREWRVR